MRKLVRKAKDVFLGYSNTKVLVRDATSNDKKIPTQEKLKQVAYNTHGFVEMQEIQSVIICRLNDCGRNWMHVFKSLLVMEYCLVFGSEAFFDYAQENIQQIRTLKDFQYIDSKHIDRGACIREKSKYVYSLLCSKDKVNSLRKENSVGELTVNTKKCSLEKTQSYPEEWVTKKHWIENEKEQKESFLEKNESFYSQRSSTDVFSEKQSFDDLLVLDRANCFSSDEKKEEDEDFLFDTEESVSDSENPFKSEKEIMEIEEDEKNDSFSIREERESKISNNIRPSKPASFRKFK